MIPEIDHQRAAWFRESLYFCDHGLSDRWSLWDSWALFCKSHSIDPGSKSSMWQWLLKIGAKHHGSLFRRVKMR